MRIAVLDDYQRLALKLADWSDIQKQAEVTIIDRPLTQADAARELRGFDVLCHLRERTAMPRTLFEQLPDLKCCVITGTEHRTLDLAAAHERGVVVSRATAPSGSGRFGTPELAWGLMLALTRQIPQSSAEMKVGGWQKHCGNVLHGKTLGLIGLGRIGSHMVPIAKAFGMDVLAWSSRLTAQDAGKLGATYASKDDLLARSDFVSLHLVLGDRSRNTLTAAEFARMKPTAYLVNTSRSGLVDSAALLEALRSKRIAGAGLDVFDEEPLPDSDPLRKLDNAILTPHLGYTTEEALRGFYTGTVDALTAYLAGKPVNVM